jgi:hypothetical protein
MMSRVGSSRVESVGGWAGDGEEDGRRG